MYLSKHDLLQMNDEWLEELPAEHLLKVSKRLLHDVKVLQDRQNQTPNNSSRPPGSQAPWERSASSSEATQETEAEAAEDDASEAKAAPKEAYTRESAPGTKGKKSEKKPGKQPGSPGHGRTQKLMVTDTCEHHPEVCAVCGSAISVGSGVLAYTAWDEIDIAPLVEGEIGLRLSVTRHLLHEGNCASCGHDTRAQTWRAPADGLWDKVDLGQWRLVGPRLAGMIVLLSLRMRLSRARIRELLVEMFGLYLSTGVIDQTIREAGRASEPLEEALVTDIQQATRTYRRNAMAGIQGFALAVGSGEFPHSAVPHRPTKQGDGGERTGEPVFGYARQRWLCGLPPLEESPALLAAPVAQATRTGGIE